MTTRRLTVAVDARMCEHSGIGTHIRNIVSRLAAMPGLELLLLGDREVLGRHPWFDHARFVPALAPIYGLREQVELAARIPRCDVLWSPHFNVPMAPVRARRRLVTIHDVFHLAYRHLLPLPHKAYAQAVLRAAVALSDRIVTVSRFSARELKTRLGVREGRLRVIPNGCDRAFGEGAAGEVPARPYLLFVGNVKPHKNVRAALAAFLRLAPAHPDLGFVIVGRKEGFLNGDPEVANLVTGEAAERIVFTGHVPDAVLKAYYRSARALVFPSLYEGFGLPLLEAMAFGIPVASSDRASMPEVGGDAVLYFDPEDPVDIAARLGDILEGRWRPDPRKYAERLAGFDWDVSAARYREVIEELAGAARGAG